MTIHKSHCGGSRAITGNTSAHFLLVYKAPKKVRLNRDSILQATAAHSKVVDVAVKQNPKALRFASEDLREDNDSDWRH